MKRTIVVILILLLCFTPAFAGRKKPRAKRKQVKIAHLALPIQPIEKEQILRGEAITNEALLLELQKRWLTLYTTEELHNEAIRRGIIKP